jgi:MbtH protein
LTTSEARWTVVCNVEEQFSVWPDHLPVPDGWRPVGDPRSRDACLDDIEARWTDMRPRSVRRFEEGERPS